MFDIASLKKMNEAEARRLSRNLAETETSRRCSYSGDSIKGVVLHSAKQRSTVFLRPGPAAKQFIAKWFGTNSETVRNTIVESYFE